MLELEKVVRLSEEGREKWKDRVLATIGQKVPLGPYPWNWKGTGWVQLTFVEADIKLAYHHYGGFCKGITVGVEAVKAKKVPTVTVTGLSEYFDEVEGKMKLQEEGWRAQVPGKNFPYYNVFVC